VEQTEDKNVRWNNRTNNPNHYYVLPRISDTEMRDIIEDLMSERPGSAQRVESSEDLNDVSASSDNVLKYGRDTYGSKHTSLTAADGKLVHVDVFVSGTEGYNTFRIPSITRTADGTLHAFAEGRLTNRSDPGGTHIDLVYKRSTDGGKNWSTLILLDRHPDTDMGNLEKDRTAAANAVALVDRTNDRLWLFDTRLVDRNLGSFQAWALYSDNSGLTWSRPQRIRVTRYELRGSSDIYPNLGSGIQMRSGRLIVPATRRTVGITQSFALYSDDNGAEWHAGEVVEAAVNEAQIVELSDGRLLMSVRPNSGGDRLGAWSSDSGEHWTKPVPLFSSTRVAEAIELYTREGENDAQRNRLLHTIPAGGPLGARSNLEIRISYDEGVSFDISRTVYSGYAAYSDLVNIDSDRVGILWERGDTTSYQCITFTLVNRTFLEPD
jgi:sialidase-1